MGNGICCGPNASGIPATGICGIGALGASNIPGTGTLVPDGTAMELLGSATMLAIFRVSNVTNGIAPLFQVAKLRGV
jgi:hypothetical protein